jgi:acyl carrier protein
MELIKSEVRGIIAGIGGLPHDFDESADLYSELKLGSFQAVDILTALEERYNVTIPDAQYTKARSLDELSRVMAALLGEHEFRP